jgi:hypothetical protein
MSKYNKSKYSDSDQAIQLFIANEAAEQNRLTRIYLEMFAEEFNKSEYIPLIKRDDA